MLKFEAAEEIALNVICDDPEFGGWGDINSLAGSLENGEVTADQVIAAIVSGIKADRERRA